MSESAPTPELISTEEAARRLGVSVWAVRNLIRHKGLPAVRLGLTDRGKLRVQAHRLDEWLARPDLADPLPAAHSPSPAAEGAPAEALAQENAATA